MTLVMLEIIDVIQRPNLEFLREALFTFRLAVWSFANSVRSVPPFLLRKIITFYRKDLRCVTGPVRLGSLTHDFEAGPKVTRL